MMNNYLAYCDVFDYIMMSVFTFRSNIVCILRVYSDYQYSLLMFVAASTTNVNGNCGVFA